MSKNLIIILLGILIGFILFFKCDPSEKATQNNSNTLTYKKYSDSLISVNSVLEQKNRDLEEFISIKDIEIEIVNEQRLRDIDKYRSIKNTPKYKEPCEEIINITDTIISNDSIQISLLTLQVDSLKQLHINDTTINSNNQLIIKKAELVIEELKAELKTSKKKIRRANIRTAILATLLVIKEGYSVLK